MFPLEVGNMSYPLVEFHTDDGDECDITCNETENWNFISICVVVRSSSLH